MKFYPETLPMATQSVLQIIKNLPELKNFYLSGGSALSLQVGHRESEDLDFFIKSSFNPQLLQQQLSKLARLEDVIIDEGTLNVFLDGVKLQFLCYPYSLLENFHEWNEIFLSSIMDIACTKLITISMRGAKKDYIDLYVILQKISLQKLIEKLEEKYTSIEYNLPHILKSLVYFEDANKQPMPKMFIPLNWDQVKNYLIQEIQTISFI